MNVLSYSHKQHLEEQDAHPCSLQAQILQSNILRNKFLIKSIT